MNMNFRKPKFDLVKVMDEIKTEACTGAFTPDGPIIDRCESHHLFVFDDMQHGRKNHDKLVGTDRTCRFVATAFTESHFHLWRRLPDAELEVQVTEVIDDEPDLTPQEINAGWFQLPAKRFQKRVISPSFEVHQSLLIPLPKHDQRDTTEWSDRNRLKDRFNHWAKIKGELWAIPRSRFREIDEWMLNGKIYERRRVGLEIPLRTVTTCGTETQVTRSIEEVEAYMYVGIPDFWEPQIDGGYNFKPVHIYERPDLSRKYYTYTNKEEDSE